MKHGDILLGGPCALNVAYYSPRPPTAPLMLVPVAVTSHPTPYLNCITTLPQQGAIAEQSVLQDLIIDLPMSANVKKSRPHRPPRVGRLISTARSVSSRRGTAATRACDSPDTISPAPTEVPPASPSFSKLSSTSSRQAEGTLRCSVATQAHTDPSTGYSDMGVITPSGESEWLGEVRALRDCHLRLVLRQLRHIAHLNRAVDRVVGAEPLLDAEPQTP